MEVLNSLPLYSTACRISRWPYGVFTVWQGNNNSGSSNDKRNSYDNTLLMKTLLIVMFHHSCKPYLPDIKALKLTLFHRYSMLFRARSKLIWLVAQLSCHFTSIIAILKFLLDL